MGILESFFKKDTVTQKVHLLGKDYEINNDALAFSTLGLKNYEKQNYQAAVADFTKAINYQPSNSIFYQMRGTAFEDMERENEAQNDFFKAIELDPRNYVAAFRLGMFYYRKKDYETAVRCLKEAYKYSIEINLSKLGLSDNNIFVVHKKIIAGNLGNFLTKLKRVEEAFTYLDDAIKIDPNYHNPYMVKGMAYAQIGRPKDGIPYLKKAAQLGNPQAEAGILFLQQLASKM